MKEELINQLENIVKDYLPSDLPPICPGEKAVESLKEALELYFEDNQSDKKFINIDQVIVGETVLNA